MARNIVQILDEIEKLRDEFKDDPAASGILSTLQLWAEEIARELDELEKLRQIVASIDVNDYKGMSPNVYAARMKLFETYTNRVRVVHQSFEALVKALNGVKQTKAEIAYKKALIEYYKRMANNVAMKDKEIEARIKHLMKMIEIREKEAEAKKELVELRKKEVLGATDDVESLIKKIIEGESNG